MKNLETNTVFIRLLILVCLVKSPLSFADECKDILRNGVRDRIIRSQNTSYRLARHLNFCAIARNYDLSSEDYFNFARDYAHRTKSYSYNGAIGIGPFQFGGGAGRGDLSENEKLRYLNENRRTVRDYYSDNCTQDDVNLLDQSEDTVLLEIANPDVVAAWRDCMQRRVPAGFLAELEKADDRQEDLSEVTYHLRLRWFSPDNVPITQLALDHTPDLEFTDGSQEMTSRFKTTGNILRAGEVMENGAQVAFTLIHTDTRRVGSIRVRASNQRGMRKDLTLSVPRRFVPECRTISTETKKTWNSIVDFEVRNLGGLKSSRPFKKGFSFCPLNLNRHHGGDCIYLGYKVNDTDRPVVDVGFVTFPWSWGRVPSREAIENALRARGFDQWRIEDLNSGAGGRFIYLGWRCGNLGERSITDIDLVETDQNPAPHREGWVAVHQDLCQGAGGSYIWMYCKYQDPLL